MALLQHVPRPEAKAVVISLTVGVGLLALKFVAYFLTQSAAIFSDALESIVNVATSSVALYSLSLAHQPADEQYPYGLGKAEFISAWFEGGMILLAAVFIVIRTIEAWATNSYLKPEAANSGLLLITAALLINGGVGIYLVRTGRRQNSMTLEADGKHLLTDAYNGIAVVVALAAVKLTGWRWADPLMALAIACYIAWTAKGLLGQASARLMDKQDAENEKMIRGILDSHVGPSGTPPRICSYHRLAHRHNGRYLWVDFHMMVPPEMSVRDGHDVASNIEGEIERALERHGLEGDATAHIEPCAEPECSACRSE